MSRSELVTIPGHVVGSRRAVDDRALPAEAGQGPAAQGGNAGGSAAEAAPGEGTDVEVRAGELAPLALPVRAFAWSSLPRLSRAAVMVARGLPLSAVDLARALDGVSSDWTHDLGAPVSISCRTVGAAHSDETFAEPGCHALLALGPDRAPACLSLDAGLASAMVERLSGGEGRPSERLAAFGAAECGVLSYLVLRALGRLGSVPLVASLAPRLVSISGAPPTAVLGCQGAITLVLAIDAGFAKGDAVLTLPPRAMTSLAALPRAPFALPPALRPLRAWLAFSVAAARVARAELAALVVGDVVVCERLAVGVSPGDENGAAVHVGALRVLCEVIGRSHRSFPRRRLAHRRRPAARRGGFSHD